PYTAGPADCEMMGIPLHEPPTLYHAKGCEKCNQLGYRGRTGIYELVTIDDTMRSMIHDGGGELQLERETRKSTPGIRQDGWRKVLEGETTVEEVLRVTQGD
ncbi:MAG: type II secretion system protein GspE, partial [Halobacteria archaeon]|nr:type II secretion system protein GspE [Halobacteria archaeon]